MEKEAKEEEQWTKEEQEMVYKYRNHILLSQPFVCHAQCILPHRTTSYLSGYHPTQSYLIQPHCFFTTNRFFKADLQKSSVIHQRKVYISTSGTYLPTSYLVLPHPTSCQATILPSPTSSNLILHQILLPFHFIYHPTLSYTILHHPTILPHPTSSYTRSSCHPTLSYLILPHITTSYLVLQDPPAILPCPTLSY